MTRTSERFASITIALVVVTGLLAAGPAVVVGQQSIPAAYSGSVTINDDPAPTGVSVIAKVDGEQYGSITVETEGQYGDPGANDYLTVQGDDLSPGDEVTFYVNGDSFSETQVNTDPSTVTWESGDVATVDLSVSGIDLGDGEDGEDGTDGEDGEDGEDGTDGGGGGGGGGGFDFGPDDDVEAEPPEPPADVEIEAEETADLVADEATGQTTATFGESNAVESVSFAGEVEGGSVNARTLSSEPESTGPAPGASARVAQITVGDDLQDTSATVRMRVPRDRIEEIDADAEDLRINRFNDEEGEWQGLETEVVDETDTDVRVEAETPGFSFFAVSAVSEPEAAIDVPGEVAVDEEFELDGSGSSDQYGEVVAYEWSVDGETLSGETVTTAIGSAGDVEIELTVENDAGETDTATATVTVGDAAPGDGEDGEDGADGEDAEEDEGISTGLGIGIVLFVVIVIIAALLFMRQQGGNDDGFV
jgi:PGF-pre-PGF domain-containing protein